MDRKFQLIEEEIIFQFEEAEEGGYVVTVPDLPGCVSEGDTIEEALEMIKDAMSGWLLVAQEHGDPIPDKYRPILHSLSVRR
jgi:predicted RNase H-like HicB family nuclease